MTGSIATAKRRSRRYAVAFRLDDDLGEVSPYQPGRTRVPIFNWAGSDDYFCALREGEQAPPGYTWEPIGEEYGYRILRARA